MSVVLVAWLWKAVEKGVSKVHANVPKMSYLSNAQKKGVGKRNLKSKK